MGSGNTGTPEAATTNLFFGNRAALNRSVNGLMDQIFVFPK